MVNDSDLFLFEVDLNVELVGLLVELILVMVVAFAFTVAVAVAVALAVAVEVDVVGDAVVAVAGDTGSTILISLGIRCSTNICMVYIYTDIVVIILL